LEDLASSAADSDLRAAYRIVSKALQQPFNIIVENAGVDIHTLATARQAVLEGQDTFLSFDALTRQVVDPFESGLLDSAGVTKAAVRSAIVSAALALTVDIVVHQKNPPQVLET
jgi:chaperonin GroEL (HSP60 family)